MGGRPRTTVTATLHPLSGAIARFALSTVRAQALRLLAQPNAPALLEAAWHAEALRGCAFLSTEEPPFEAWPGVRVVRASDPVMTLNVLGRSRGGMLLASAPLVLDLDHLDRAVYSEDARLVALAGRRRSK